MFQTTIHRRSTGAPAGRRAGGSELTVRHGVAGDISRVRRLAALDSRRVPAGELLVAEADGELVAAVSVEGRGSVADPFRPTADVVSLLELRAAQLATPADEASPAPRERRAA